MTLPVIDSPIYFTTLPLSKKDIKFRPFKVKEQRNLLMALESGDKDTMEKNIKQILSNCTLTEKINIDKLPILDVEFYFLQLRARSVGEVVHNKYKCENEVDGVVCGNTMEVDINLTEVKIDIDPSITNEIQLTDKIIIKMKYPEYSFIESASAFNSDTELAFNMILDSIEYIFDGEQYHYASEVPRQELNDFVDSLGQEQFSKIEAFFNNLPTMKKDILIKCKKCGFEHKITIEGIEDFFG